MKMIHFPITKPLVVGSIGDSLTLRSSTPESLARECDIVEIRLDLLHREVASDGAKLWEHLLSFPLLFTARCRSEGSPFDLSLQVRQNLLASALDHASLVDIEVANIPHFTDVINVLKSKNIPWIASFHDFASMPLINDLEQRAHLAKMAGANTFKCAAHLSGIDDLAALAKFQNSNNGIPVSSMGMGNLGPVSRLLCAQAGSVLNYGYVGDLETAPGQFPARLLLQCILSLKPMP